MLLTDGDFEEVAAFFAKRFPPPASVETHPAGPHADWVRALEHATARGTLHRLAAEAAAKDPSDANLQAMCALMTRTRPSLGGPLAFMAGAASGAMAIGTAMLVVATAWMASQGSPAHEVAQVTPDEIEALAGARADEPTQSVPPPDSGLRTPNSELRTPVSGVEAKHEPPTPRHVPVAAPPPARRPAPVAAAAMTPAEPGTPDEPPDLTQVTKRCWRGEGKLVGYWYGGKDLLGQVGDVITMDRSLYVRADYPDHHNRYNAKTAVQCVVRKGERVRLTEQPKLVPGNSYWMPLVSGDVLEETAQLETREASGAL